MADASTVPAVSAVTSSQADTTKPAASISARISDGARRKLDAASRAHITGKTSGCTGPAMGSWSTNPLEFDGREDSLFHPYDVAGRRHMEYLHDHGPSADVPAKEIIETFERCYPGLVARAPAPSATQFRREAEHARERPTG